MKQCSTFRGTGQTKSPENRRKDRQQPPEAALPATWRTAAPEFLHHQSKIEAGDMDQPSFDDVAMPSQVNASQASRLVIVGHAALDFLGTQPCQSFAMRPTHPPMVGIGGLLLGRSAAPASA